MKDRKVEVAAEIWRLTDQIGNDFALIMTDLDLLEQEHAKCGGECRNKIKRARGVVREARSRIKQVAAVVKRQRVSVSRTRLAGLK